MAKKSLIDRISQKSSETFIGRSDFLNNFIGNFESSDPAIIFNIYGQGGVGKSYLSRKYLSISEEKGCLPIYTDESIQTLLEWLENVSSQFKMKDMELTDFDKRYKTYLQETKKLETDPEKPKGTFAGLVKTAAKGLIKEGKKWIPGGELVGEFVNEDFLSSAISEWSDFVRKKTTNKDDIELVLDPLKNLTPLFWKGISKNADQKKFLCFFLDTFEKTGVYLETWLLDVFNNKYGDDIPANLILVIAGRDELQPNKWSFLSNLLQSVPLEPFTSEEASNYLIKNNIVEPDVIKDILHFSGGLPVLMAWLVETAKSKPLGLEEMCETAVERFLKWIEDDNQKLIAINLALTRTFNEDVLSVLVENKSKAKVLFDWVLTQPFVHKKGISWTYHKVVREQMLRFFRSRSKKDWEKLHIQLSKTYAQWQKDLELSESDCYYNLEWLKWEQERTYHLLCAKPTKHISETIARVVKVWLDAGLNESRQWANTLQEAGEDNDDLTCKEWGIKIITALDSLTNEKDLKAFQALIEDILLKNFVTDDNQKALLFFGLGKINYNSDDPDCAINNYQKAIDIKPLFADAMLGLCYAYMKKKDYSKALEYCLKAEAIDPGLSNISLQIGVLYAAKKEYNNALEWINKNKVAGVNATKDINKTKQNEDTIAHLQKAIDIGPKYDSNFSMGIYMSALGKYDEAIEYYKKAIDIYPGDPVVLKGLGKSYFKMGNYEKASEYYEHAVKVTGNDPELFTGMGDISLNTKDYDLAMKYYQQAIEIESDFPAALTNIGKVYSSKGDYDKAIEYCQKAIDTDPDYFEALYLLSTVYSAKQDYDQALKYCHKANAVWPANYQVLNVLGHIYLKQGDFSSAIFYFESALNLSENNYLILTNLGAAYLTQELYDKAIEYFQKALAIRPDYINALDAMGNAFFNTKDYDKAIDFYQQAIEIQADFPNTLNNLGKVYFARGDYNTAIDYYKKAANIKAESFDALLNLAEAYNMIHENDAALQYYEKAIETKPNEIHTYINLSFLCIQLGNLKKAKQHLYTAIDLGSKDVAKMNLGHVLLAENREDEAIACYTHSLNAFNDKKFFWDGMQDDLKYLLQYGITPQKYQGVLDKIALSAGVED